MLAISYLITIDYQLAFCFPSLQGLAYRPQIHPPVRVHTTVQPAVRS
jgi:hypothetical protein